MKKLFYILLLTLTLNAATVNNSANLTIGQGVVMRVDGDLVNTGSITNNGLLSLSGTLTGFDTQGQTIGYFGDAQITSNQFGTLVIEGNATIALSTSPSLGGVMVGDDFILQDGILDLGGWNVHLGEDGQFIQQSGNISGQGYVIGNSDTGLGLTVSDPYTHNIGLNGNALTSNEVQGISKNFFINSSEGEHTIVLSYSDDDLNGLDANNLGLFQSPLLFDEDGVLISDVSSLEWIYAGGEVDTDNQTITLTTSNSSGYWTAGEVGCVDNQATNYLSSAFGGAYHCIYDYQYSLSAGANLISFYGADDNDMFIENMMSSLEMASGIVGQGEAAQKLPNGAWVGSLVEIDRSSGYWVLLALPDTTSIVGGAMNHETQYCINEGVNLLSFSGSQATSVADALPDEIEPYIDGIIGQGEAAQQFGGNWLGSLTHFDKWGGYWFKSISEQEICFTYEGGITLPRSAVMYVDTSVPDNLSFTQSTKQSFFFIEEPKNMDENHYVVAVVGQTIIGAAPHQGEITTVPAMGMDFQDDTYDYATDGQNIELLVHDGQEYVGRLVGPHTAKWEDMGMKMMQNMAMMPLTPESYSLYPAYPNPFNPSTEIRFDLPADSKITLEVYDIQGRMVSQLVNGNMQAGYHRVKWNASDKASGVYFVNMRSGSYAQTQKLMLIK